MVISVLNIKKNKTFYAMKKLRFIVAAIGLIIISAGCNMGKSHRTISVQNNDLSLKIEYSGTVIFNDDETAIESISSGGYVRYCKNGKKLKAENNHGEITYELYNGNKKLSLEGNDKEFLADAIKEMIKYGHNADNR